jgi:phosphohistidine swiveling domain-containing protein
VSFVADLDASDVGSGGKARSLARLAALGFATPSGFVVRDEVFRALCPHTLAPEQFDQSALWALDRIRHGIDVAPWPDGFLEELESRLQSLGGNRFSVRSSFASEDVAGALAAGIYESCVDVPLGHVESAIRRVLGSAMSPGAAAYAMAHGRNPGDAPIAVLVHAFASGEAEGSAAFAPGSTPEPVFMVRQGSLPDGARLELRAGLERLARGLGPVEIEWVWSGQRLVYLQLRPFQPKAPPVEWPGWRDLPPSAGERDGWHWDMAHNPLPLSPAQAGLVEFVDTQCQIGMRQRVLGGYLFYARDPRSLPAAIAPEDAGEFFEGLRQDFQAQKAKLGATPALDDALSLFADVYQRIFGVLQPALRRARRELQDFLGEHAPAQLALLPALCAGVPSVAEERRRRALAIRQASGEGERTRARAAYLALFGDEAPVWDVCAPTYAEDSSSLSHADDAASKQVAPPDWQSASTAVQGTLSESQREAWRGLLTLAREALSLSEADDWLYARAQAVVRRSLLATGQALQRAGQLPEASEVFFLPLHVVRGIGPNAPAVGSLAEVANAGRVAWQAAQKNPPPAAVLDDGQVVRGHGTGGHAVGRVVVHQSGSLRRIAVDSVLLAPTLLPTELPLVSAVAIVTETGGPLDHVAAQARERGIPAVIGAAGAGSVLHEGDLVLVDGERGLVVGLERARRPASEAVNLLRGCPRQPR